MAQRKSSLIPSSLTTKLKIAAGIFAAGSVVGSALEVPPVTAYLELLTPSAVTETPAEPPVTESVPAPEVPAVSVLPDPPQESTEKLPESPTESVPSQPAVTPVVPTPAESVLPETPAVTPEPPVYEESFDWMEGIFVPAEPSQEPTSEENDWMDVPAWDTSDSLSSPTVPGGTQTSSMTEKLAGLLENLAVFWSTGDNKIHLDPTCTSGVLFAGTLEEAQTVRADGWCRRCAEHLDGTDNSVFYIKGNSFAVPETLSGAYTFSDYQNKIPSSVFGG